MVQFSLVIQATQLTFNAAAYLDRIRSILVEFDLPRNLTITLALGSPTTPAFSTVTPIGAPARGGTGFGRRLLMDEDDAAAAHEEDGFGRRLLMGEDEDESEGEVGNDWTAAADPTSAVAPVDVGGDDLGEYLAEHLANISASAPMDANGSTSRGARLLMTSAGPMLVLPPTHDFIDEAAALADIPHWRQRISSARASLAMPPSALQQAWQENWWLRWRRRHGRRHATPRRPWPAADPRRADARRRAGARLTT